MGPYQASCLICLRPGKSSDSKPGLAVHSTTPLHATCNESSPPQPTPSLCGATTGTVASYLAAPGGLTDPNCEWRLPCCRRAAAAYVRSIRDALPLQCGERARGAGTLLAVCFGAWNIDACLPPPSLTVATASTPLASPRRRGSCRYWLLLKRERRRSRLVALRRPSSKTEMRPLRRRLPRPRASSPRL